MIARHLTFVHFALALALAVASVGVALVLRPWGVLAIAASAAYSVWALRRSEHRGFVRTGQMRRAFEPERHFNGAQVTLLFLALMAQAVAAAYALVGDKG